MSEPRDGVIYVATGTEYADLARASAESLKAHEPRLAADIYTDVPEAVSGGPFDRVLAAPGARLHGRLECLSATRFERTLFLDADTLVLRPLGDLFDVLDRFDIAAAHDMRRTSALIRAGQRHAAPYAVPQLNCGVLLYRRAPAVLAFLDEWALRVRESGAARDQPVFRDLIWETDLRLWVLPPEFNLRRVTMLDAWEPQDVLPTILHSHRLLDHVRRPGAPRLRSLEEVLAAERVALAREWQDAADWGHGSETLAKAGAGAED